MMQYGRELGGICGNLVEENGDWLSKRISLQSDDLIKESGKKSRLLGQLQLLWVKRGTVCFGWTCPPSPQNPELWGSFFINILQHSLLGSLQAEASCVAISVPNGLLHYSPCKSVRNTLTGNWGLEKSSEI